MDRHNMHNEFRSKRFSTTESIYSKKFTPEDAVEKFVLFFYQYLFYFIDFLNFVFNIDNIKIYYLITFTIT